MPFQSVDPELQEAQEEQEQRRRETEALNKDYDEQSAEFDEYLRAQEFEETQQQSRSRAADAAKQAVNQKVKAEVKKAVVKSGTRAALAATSEIWIPALAILAVIGVLLMLMMVTVTSVLAMCNGAGDWKVRWAKNYITLAGKLAPLSDVNVCKNLAFEPQLPQQTTGTQAPATSVLVNIPREYVNLSSFGVSIADFPRVKQSVLSRIEDVIARARAEGLTVTITSALRRPVRYAYGCHTIGEAVDFALRPPIPISRNPSTADVIRINKLIKAGREAGFQFVKDEYREAIEDRTTGGHVHFGLIDGNCRDRQSEIPADTEFFMPY